MPIKNKCKCGRSHTAFGKRPSGLCNICDPKPKANVQVGGVTNLAIDARKVAEHAKMEAEIERRVEEKLAKAKPKKKATRKKATRKKAAKKK